ncbi:MAG: 3-isopropylmalate dehydratase large subunit [Porticoccaceae bacterium]|jgi:3-isopropylmalate/(R)-2-methylmalate dehydratase large subunit|nr:3-isopropylmalate dehydratase large subunit [Porticoccaceae bacterium]MBT3799173.1 3-isopropylmalate dehydratase large subunit [Porticoccaceae bacterium]MBT4163772.1 3-isopropylmalate dehydratase large subunit [Porticoccaceae bacterium]MBT4210491.1 3-isopropylmalate dehydratase large subunit [Porticoccaceae bacterium]MBT4592589.1 3-isopropylmalate dehydratase large subunit [Porticoccaceae bacterium]
MKPKTLYDKLWDMHEVTEMKDGTSLLYIDRHILHEVTSAQAFEGLRENNRKPWRVDSCVATPDHNVPTTQRQTGMEGVKDAVSRIQILALDSNCAEFGIREYKLNDIRQGIVHVIGPEQGLTLPGMTLVCGDSHTSTHGAFACLAQGIGTSDVEHVLATQCLAQKKFGNMLINVEGDLPRGVSAKDMILYIIGKIGTAGATGMATEFAGSTIRALSMEGRMTICNMAIEAGSRVGMIAYDEVTFDYIRGRAHSPKGDLERQACRSWENLHSDVGAKFDAIYEFNAADISPHVSWGTSPEMVIPIDGTVPDPSQQETLDAREDYFQALNYMGLTAGQKITDVQLDRIFVGSCTNSRIEDIRSVAEIVKGKHIAASIKQAMVVPGSGLVKQQAEDEGLDKVLLDAGFEWRDPGCSMCVAINSDKSLPGEHCASTSNRNFEGRQGHGSRTHLVSPQMAAAAALAGHFIDIREII